MDDDTIRVSPGSDDTWPAEIDDDLTFRDRELFGRFTILDTLGVGGMGVVLSAYDPQLDRKVAIKVLRTRGLDGGRHAKEADRLLGEARAMAQLSHPHVVTVYEAGTIDGRVYVAMEYVSGQTLRAWLAEQTRTVGAILDVLVKAGRGLAAGHHAGLVHRDFKPDNVLIGHDGRVRVIDFGLAVPPGPVGGDDAGDSHRLTGPVGTPMYMAPEQHDGRALDARTDQFAFCVSVYEALYGRAPFPTGSYPLLVHAVLAGEVIVPAPDPRIAPRIVDAVLRGLRPAPDDRFAIMDELLDELQPRTSRRRAPPAVWMAGVAMFAAITTLVVMRVAGVERQTASASVAPDGIDSGVAAYRLGADATSRDDCTTAIRHYEHALQILDKTSPEHPVVGVALVALADCRERTGDPTRAIADAERGIRVVDAGHDQVQLALGRYVLAKALWAAGRDRKRAIELAAQARKGFAAGGLAALDGLTAVDDWFATTGASKP